MTPIKRILLTPGEPAGVGPDITVKIAQQAWPAELIAIADPDLLLSRAKKIGLPLRLIECDLDETRTIHQAGSLKILPIPLNTPVNIGQLNPTNASYVIATLQKAASLCQKKIADAVVTGPVNKEVINDAGISFTGHTEFFAQCSGAKHTVMLFVVDELKIALATTHLPLAEVSKAITKKRLRLVISILEKGLQQLFRLPTPRIMVCGLNPHAGEGGYLGREEIDTIAPVLVELNEKNYHLDGPLPADTIFTPNQLKKADAILAMYHDQALPLVKYIGFNHAVNVTLGLPFIRTSVDHGTALAIAGTPEVDAGSFVAAIQCAINLCK